MWRPRRINQKYGWGKVNHILFFFRSHTLRKLNATFIEDKNLADTLQGCKPDLISGAYFKQNSKRLREKYLDHLDKLTVYDNCVTVIRSDEIRSWKWQNNMLQVETEKLKVETEKYCQVIDYIKDKLNSLDL